MNKIMLLLALISAPAFATNVMYSPVPDPVTNAPAVMYLTDQHSRACQGKWYKGHIVNTATDKDTLTVDLCWSVGSYRGWNLWIPSTGMMQENVSGFGAVPGTRDIFDALLKNEASRMRAETESEVRAFKEAQPEIVNLVVA